MSEDIFRDTFSLSAPSEKARRHALTMCRQDPHYKPRTRNPFAALTHFTAGKKFLGNFSSCCEIPSPFVELSTDSHRSLPGSPTPVRKASVKQQALFAHPLFKGGSSTNLLELNENGNPTLRRRGSCESGFYSSVGECLSPSSLWDSGTAVNTLISIATDFFFIIK